MKSSEVAEMWEANAETWTRHARAGYDVYRDALNTPAFLLMLPPISDLYGLDVGCGEGSNTRELARLGAQTDAIDIGRPSFATHSPPKQAIRSESSSKSPMPFHFPSPTTHSIFLTAFMSRMDMPDQGHAMREAHRELRPGGFFQFSILHPCFAPPHRRVLRNADGTTRAIEVGCYFDAVDGEVETWWFGTLPREEGERVAPFRTPRFHRTLSG